MRNQDEEYLANRFLADVDRLLEQQDRIEETPVPAEYEELLDVARRLASLDLSAGHPLRERLRRDLMARYCERQGRHRRAWAWPRPQWRPALAGLAAVLLCIALLTLYPPVRTLAQETWQNALHTVQLVRALPRLTGRESAALTAQVESPAEAASLVGFPVHAPSYLPQDYEFRFGLVSHTPTREVFFDYGIPASRIVTLPSGRAVSARAFQGIHISQQKADFPGEWPIGQATIQEVTVRGQPALWLTGLPLVRSEARVTVRTTVRDREEVGQEILSHQTDQPEVLGRTPATALLWEEGDVLLSVLDLDGRFSLEEMMRIADGLVPIAPLSPESLPTPTPRPEWTWQEIPNLQQMVAGASFSPYVLAPLPQGWRLERIASLSPPDAPLERRYFLTYRHSPEAYVRLIQGLDIPLESWYNYIEGSGALRHVTRDGLEVWTSDVHQWAEESVAQLTVKENARLNDRPVPEEVHAMFVRTPDGFSLELVAVGISWDETLALVEYLTLAPGADPALNSRLMKGCYPCP